MSDLHIVFAFEALMRGQPRMSEEGEKGRGDRKGLETPQKMSADKFRNKPELNILALILMRW